MTNGQTLHSMHPNARETGAEKGEENWLFSEGQAPAFYPKLTEPHEGKMCGHSFVFSGPLLTELV